MKKLSILFLLISQFSFAQSSFVTETIKGIEFKEDTVKSVFDWLAHNIKYDVKKMKQIENGTFGKKLSEFRNKKEQDRYLLETVIKRKKGVCEDYALLFDELVGALGYESYVVTGYTKTAEGKLNRKIGHAWNAIKVNGTWQLYDATWGAGYVEDGRKFVKSYGKEWCDMPATEFAKTHMPFDPVWQLAANPMTYSDFENNTEAAKSATSYDYESLITAYLSKSEKEKMKEEVSRSKSLGKGIRLIESWRKNTTKNANLYDLHSQPELMDETFKKYNNSVDLFNDYIKAKNKNFKGRKWTPDYAKQNLKKAEGQISDAIATFKSVSVEDKKATRSIAKMLRDADKLLKAVGEELDFLEKM